MPHRQQNKSKSLDTPYTPGDSIPSPLAQESETDSAWADFHALHARLEAGFAATVPGFAPSGLQHDDEPAYAPTQPAGSEPEPAAPRPAPLAMGNPRVTVDDVMVLARRNNRVCPLPAQWQQLYELLPHRSTNGRIWQPAQPISGEAWTATSAMPKRMCLRDHIEWAASHGALPAIHAFLEALPEDQWHHVGD